MRARRRLDIFAVLSLLLCVATVALWVRSHAVGDEVRYLRATPRYSWAHRAVSKGGYLSYRLSGRPGTMRIEEWPPNRWQWLRGERAGQSAVTQRAELRYLRLTAEQMERSQYPLQHVAVASVPHWLLTTGLAAPPIAALVRFARRRRRGRPANACPACGYDLRATPDRCPECGLTAPLASRGVSLYDHGRP